MKIAYITTVSHDPGDEFIYAGVRWLMEAVFPNHQAFLVHKHDPRTIFFETDKHDLRAPRHRLLAALSLLLYRAIHRPGRDKLAEADLVVFSGTPFLWRQKTHILPSTTANAEWNAVTWKRLFTSLPRVPVVNLGAGSEIHDQAHLNLFLMDSRVTSFVRQACNRCAITTVRDKCAKRILADLALDAPLLPCPSIFAANGLGIEAKPPEYIALNYIRGAFGRSRGAVNYADRWRIEMLKVVAYYRTKGPIRFICHSTDVFEAAREFASDSELLFSMDPRVLLDAYSRAAGGIYNRVHAAMGSIAFGRPAVVVGHGSRMTLVSEVGGAALDVRDVVADPIIDVFDRQLSGTSTFSAAFRTHQMSALSGYKRLLSSLAPAIQRLSNPCAPQTEADRNPNG